MNNIQPIKFYSSRAETLSARKAIRGDYSVPSIVIDRNSFIPFCLKRVKTQHNTEEVAAKYPITTCNIINVDTGKVINLLSKFKFNIGTGKQIAYTSAEEYILYAGNSTNLNLPKGLYYFEIKDSYDYPGETYNSWYSNDFRLTFKSKTVKFEFRNAYTLSDNDIWFPETINRIPFFYILELPMPTYETGEYFDFADSIKDINEFSQYGFQVFYKIRGCKFIVDSDVLDCIKLIKLISNAPTGTVYMTDESGTRNLIEITDLQIEPISGHYATVDVKYRVKDSEIRSNLLQSVEATFYQESTETPELISVDKLLRTYDKKVKTTHGKYIRRNKN
jgi:hypothetical protein